MHRVILRRRTVRKDDGFSVLVMTGNDAFARHGRTSLKHFHILQTGVMVSLHAKNDARGTLDGVGRPHRFSSAGSHCPDKFPMEIDAGSLLRSGVGTNRLADKGPSVHRVTPARC